MVAVTQNVERGDVLIRSLIVVLLLTAAVVVAYPLYFVVIASISNPGDVLLGRVVIWPVNPTVDGYRAMLENNEIWTGYRNTLFYTVAGTSLSLAVTLPGAYALSRRNLKGYKLIMGVLTFTLFFGGGLIPTYFLYRRIGILNTAWVMILPGTVSVYNLIIARTFYRSTIPDELVDAARIDGASDFQFFRKVVLPLSSAITAVLTLYYGVARWNAYFEALVFLRDRDLFPLQLILREILIGAQIEQELLDMASSSGTKRALLQAESIKYAVIIASSLPMLLLYPMLQKYFMKGVMVGSLKG